MDYISETFKFSDMFRFQMFRTNSRQMLMHCHDCLEINLIEAGRGHYIIEEKSYEMREGDLFIINNSERHMAVHEEQLSMLVIIFEPDFIWGNSTDYDFLEPFYNRSSYFSNRIRNDSESYEELKIYIERISQEYFCKREGWQMVVKASVMLFLAVLYRHCIHNHELGGDVKNLHQFYERIRPVMDYIHDHFKEQITLDDLAKEVMMNKSYLSSYFAEVMKIRIFEYIDQVRINHACLLLKTTELSITEIGLESGFNSPSYFNKTFKKILEMTPGMYRKK